MNKYLEETLSDFKGLVRDANAFAQTSEGVF